MSDETVNVRYMVDDVAAAVDFYTSHLGFTVLSSTPPAFADVRRPHPGGWNRIHLLTDDLDAEIVRLKAEGVPFRNDVVTGPGGSQVLVVDPSENLVELFQPGNR